MFDQFKNTRTGQKMAGFKRQADQRNAKNPNLSPSNWRWYAKHAFQFGPGHMRYSFNAGQKVEKFFHLSFYCGPNYIPGYRDCKKAGEIIRLDHTGWYGDIDQNETLAGVVGVFRWGKYVWVTPGVEYSDSDCDYFDLMSAVRMPARDAFDAVGDKSDLLIDVMHDMARRADQLAEWGAEKNRESDEKYQAEQLCEQLAESIKDSRIEALKLIREIKKAGKTFSPSICNALRDKLGELLGHVNQCRKAIKTINDSPFEYTYSKFYSLV